MRGRAFQLPAIAVCFFALGTATGFSQAIFIVGSVPLTSADIGYAEAAGPITLAVITGTTVAAPVIITYSAPITNNNASEISISGTGTLAGAKVEIDLEKNSILMNLPAGGLPGDQIILSGVRVAIADTGLSEVSASLSSPAAMGNQFVAGQTHPIVVGRIMQPFVMDQSAIPPLSFADGMPAQTSTYFSIVEKYPNALVGSSDDAGRIRIVPFPSIPEGIRITLDATAPSIETGAFLTTLSGNSETIPREDGSTDVVYRLAEAPGSSTTLESFVFRAAMTGTAPGAGKIQFQAELLPIGLAVPNDEFPSRDMPRYAERFVPDEIDLVSGSTELFIPYPIQSENSYTGIALTNPSQYRVRATLSAFDTAGRLIAGNNITNPVQVELPRRGQYAKLASQIFGNDYNSASAGTIRIAGQTPLLPGFYLTGDNSGPKLDGSIGNVASVSFWHLPVVFHDGIAPFNLLELYNPGNSDANITLELMDVNGNQLATGVKDVVAGGTSAFEITQFFNVNLSSFQGGYIRGKSEQSLIVRENFGNVLESNVLSNQSPEFRTAFFIPHFASGGQYSTELNLVNTNSNWTADLTLTPLNDAGERISDSAQVLIKPRAQFIATVASLFPELGDGLVTGSIKVEVKPIYRGPFTTAPGLVGSIRFSNTDGSASAALPLSMSPASDFVYSHVAQDNTWFTGVAVLNADTTPANLTVTVYHQDGSPAGTYAFQLGPGERFSKLLFQLVPESAGQVGGYIRFSSNVPLTSFALFGTADLKSLSAIPPQRAK